MGCQATERLVQVVAGNAGAISQTGYMEMGTEITGKEVDHQGDCSLSELSSVLL